MKNGVYPDIKLFLNTVKKHPPSVTTDCKVFTILREQILFILQDQQKSSWINCFDIISWIESKIEKKEFSVT